MTGWRKALTWIAWGVGAGVLAVVALWGISRLRGPGTEQRAALALMEQETPPQGRNGFAALWLLDRPVPTAGQARRLAEAAASIARTGYVSQRENPGSRDYVEGAEASRYCGWREAACLNKVRADTAGYVELVRRDAALLARLDSLAGYDYFLSSLPPDPAVALPPYQFLKRTGTRNALDFVQGRLPQSLEGVCRDALTARKLWRQPDHLLQGMIALAMFEGASSLMAEMLSELPAETVLPANCAAAFAPFGAAEASACPVMRGEFRFTSAIFSKDYLGRHETSSEFSWLVMDPQMTRARIARDMAWPCMEGAAAQLTVDQPMLDTRPAQGWFALECVSNAGGCVLADVAAPTYRNYQRRTQDGIAQAQVMAMLLWLRRQDPATGIDQLLAQRPPELAGPRRGLRYDAGARSLSLQLLQPQEGRDTWSVPLPGTRPLPTEN